MYTQCRIAVKSTFPARTLYMSDFEKFTMSLMTERREKWLSEVAESSVTYIHAELGSSNEPENCDCAERTCTVSCIIHKGVDLNDGRRRTYQLVLRECKPGGYFSNPGLWVWPHSNPGTRVWHMVGHLWVADSQIAYYKQLRDGQMEVWLARYLDDSRRSVPVLQKRQLKQHHMSSTSTSRAMECNPGTRKLE